jgi:hypothetical protein
MQLSLFRLFKIFSSETTWQQSLERTTHKCFLPSFGSFGQAVSEEENIKNQRIRNKSRLWWPCLPPEAIFVSD